MLAVLAAQPGSPVGVDHTYDEGISTDVIRNVVSDTAATSDHLDAILAAVSDDIASAGDALAGLVRRVLLAALELREGRRRNEQAHRAA
jgi:hypothetical protein